MDPLCWSGNSPLSCAKCKFNGCIMTAHCVFGVSCVTSFMQKFPRFLLNSNAWPCATALGLMSQLIMEDCSVAVSQMFLFYVHQRLNDLWPLQRDTSPQQIGNWFHSSSILNWLTDKKHNLAVFIWVFGKMDTVMNQITAIIQADLFIKK